MSALFDYGSVLSIHLTSRCARLQDISPEDLFPPVSFSISEKADEDMPYTKPATDDATSSTAQAAKEKPQSSGRSESRVPNRGNGNQAFTQPRGASDELEVRLAGAAAGDSAAGNGASAASSGGHSAGPTSR